jgi:predicted aminopeptidase
VPYRPAPASPCARVMWTAKQAQPLFLVLLAALLAGCNNMAYYGQAIRGHFELMVKAIAIDQVLADPATKPKLADRLRLVQRLRRFAVEELHLPDNGSYHRYADLRRPFVTWVVVATEPFSVDPKRWCFPLVGCLSYHGYFRQQDALAEAEELRRQGLDVDVAGSQAYSSLGWFDDPVLNTMLGRSEAQLAETLFHELVHQQIYLKHDTELNEALAVAIARHGTERWLRRQGKRTALDDYRQDLVRRDAFRTLCIDTRNTLARLYATRLDRSKMLDEKQRLLTDMKQRYQALRASWHGYTGYDDWMRQDLNNAHLALVATYQTLLPQFQSLLRHCHHDLERFYRKVRLWEVKKPDQRRQELNNGYCPADT